MMKTSAQENGTPWDVLQCNEAALNAMVRFPPSSLPCLPCLVLSWSRLASCSDGADS
jgi:hypothetical protein